MFSLKVNNLARRKTSHNAESLESYKDLIEQANADLEARLENIDEKIELLLGQTVAESNSDTSELRLIQEERLSTEKCLQICAQLSDHIDQIQLTTKRSGSFSGPNKPDALPERLTSEGLQECKKSLSNMNAKLERHMNSLLDRMLANSTASVTSEGDFTDLARLRAEWETTRQCMDICSKADTNLKENVSSIDNYATGDALQFMVSTNEKTIHGRNRGLGWRSRQVGGHLSDVSVQQISRDMTTINIRHNGNEGTSPQGNTSSVPDYGTENAPASEFKERYGRGFQLTPKASSTSNVFNGFSGVSDQPKR